MFLLCSVSHSSKLIKPAEGVTGTSNLKAVAEKHRGRPGRVTGVRRGSGWGEPLTCGIRRSLRVDGIRIEVNYRAPGRRIAWCGENPFTGGADEAVSRWTTGPDQHARPVPSATSDRVECTSASCAAPDWVPGPKAHRVRNPGREGTERLGSVSSGEAGGHSRAGRVHCPLFRSWPRAEAREGQAPRNGSGGGAS